MERSIENKPERRTEKKVERFSEKKHKMGSIASMGSSVLISKNNSPVKFSLRNSQVILAGVEEPNKLKDYKFYYQIGFGGFGRVWKVCQK
jgi:hypothetical protein